MYAISFCRRCDPAHPCEGCQHTAAFLGEAFAKIDAVYKQAMVKSLWSLVWTEQDGSESKMTRPMAEDALKVFSEAKQAGLLAIMEEMMQSQPPALPASEPTEPLTPPEAAAVERELAQPEPEPKPEPKKKRSPKKKPARAASSMNGSERAVADASEEKGR